MRRVATYRGPGTTKQQAAFTLLELLVSLALFAILSIVAYGGLQSVLNARHQTEQQAQRLTELQMLFSIMGRDIEQIIQRGIRDNFGDRQAALSGDTNHLEFSRTGRRNPGGFARSHLQRVGYLWQEDEIRRRSWRVMDRAQDSAFQEGVLATDIQALEFRYLDEQLQWHSRWPLPKQNGSTPPVLPRAIEATIEAEGWGHITRLFRVPRGIVVKSQQHG